MGVIRGKSQSQPTDRDAAAARGPASAIFGQALRWRPSVLTVAAGVLCAFLAMLPLAGGLTVSEPPPRMVQAAQLVADADAHYLKYAFDENEKAIVLYQRAARMDPDLSRAQSGLANALAQRALRWPMGDHAGAKTFKRLDDALKAGYVDQEAQTKLLQRASRASRRAVVLAPRDAAAYKAYALVQSAQRDFDGALDSYRRAIELDADAWGSLMNAGDILEMQGKSAEAVTFFERAYEAMARSGGRQMPAVPSIRSELGIHIGDAYRARGQFKKSAQWYRRVLDAAPMDPRATGRLATVLQQSGDAKAAQELCEALRSQGADSADCRI